MTTKIIFLDHDGVICLSNNWGSRSKKPDYSDKTTPLDNRMDNFDEKAVKVLNAIIEETGAEIVISSDWKLHGTLEEMQEMYRTRGIKPPIDYTPRLQNFDKELSDLCNWKGWPSQARSTEIHQWLKLHPQVTHWVAVDDLDMGLKPKMRGDADWGLRNFVLTPRSSEGIKQIGIKQKIVKHFVTA